MLTLAAYTGHETLMFLDYQDVATGRALTAVPGGVYDVAPAGGRNVPALPPGFTVVAVKRQARVVVAVPEDAAAEGSAELQLFEQLH
jgi:hypothetical protein